MQFVTPVAAHELDVVNVQATRVVFCDGECRLADVAADDVAIGPFAGDGERNRAAAGAQIGDALRVPARQEFEGNFDETFCLGSRHQRCRRHGERQGPEIPVTEDVGDRFTGQPALHQRFEGGYGIFGWRFIGMREQPGPVGAERTRQQEFRIEPRRITDGGESFFAGGQQ